MSMMTFPAGLGLSVGTVVAGQDDIGNVRAGAAEGAG